jgi:putative transposase
MSRARPVLPNTTYAETMRTLSRELRFAGTAEEREEISQIYLYSLAHAARKYAVEVHGFNLNDDHSHQEHTDLLCNDPAFRQLKNSLVARAMNALQGRRGTFWSPDRCVQVLADEHAQLDTFAYILANPVKHGLVANADDFPGPRSKPSDIGKPMVIKKPKSLFREKNLPAEVTLTLTVPPALRDRPPATAIARLAAAVAAREAAFNAQRLLESRPFLGTGVLLRTRPTQRPRAEETDTTARPRYIKCGDPGLLRLLSQDLHEFRRSYAYARERFKTDPSVTFPFGTWRLPFLEEANIEGATSPPARAAPRSSAG